ncbi:MAG: proton glutamate symport protein [Cryomorphaceae bacterium]|jgi:proton glutamate symport protein
MNQSTSQLRRHLSSLSYLIRGKLWVQILLGMVLGIALGLALSPQGGGIISLEEIDGVASWMALPGKLFLAVIQMVVVPLVVASIILGIAASGDTTSLKRMGFRIFPYFLGTTIISVTLGIMVAKTVEPGQFVDVESVQRLVKDDPGNVGDVSLSADLIKKPTITERIVSVVPSNLTEAVLQRSMMQIVVFAIFMGIALLAIGEARASPILKFSRSLQEACMKIVAWAMAIAPIAVFSLLASITVEIGIDAILSMTAYVLTVVAGLFILLVFYLLIVWLVARRSPWKFLSDIRPVQLLAFSTSSSAAVMPLSIQIAQDKLKVSPTVAGFTIPLGATVNMDGTAIYQVIATVFLAQVYGIDMSTGTLILIAMSTVGASIGAPSTPGVGIVILATILQEAGIPASGIALILGVDRILDMLRTSVNVTGDLTACVVMERWVGTDQDLSQPPP